MTDRQAMSEAKLAEYEAWAAGLEQNYNMARVMGNYADIGDLHRAADLRELVAEIRALRTERQEAEERERRLEVLVACLWDDGGCEGDIDHAAAYRWLGIPVPGSDEYGDAFERMVGEFAARGRAVVAEGKEGQG